ncbi:triphosphoribosyl-dephospho-CoA synthase [Lysinibacillus agricola]|uniref:triphosphoribosyl-dephospho-CoA synthase n=1 Tax=Lysinibacillus agricola TaxID=2590012 RepID=A0ABX7B0C6_9BACI|nr:MULTISPECIES: triphosphoribosyl-dephospho-CoA synthase [Lysinibacillus]KOS62926.1 2-(5'-triphosphoribosyl)-3'-dephospho CoA synthase [Lysinibacillus sp. FJAT-14222]QQP13894.1 triphosphoribosyl-dephospho-CoA synthase [Lysinibacillus agricola]
MIDKQYFAETLAKMAVSSLIEEVSLTPKPGLVDEKDEGAHQDLTFHMMIGSAQCLKNTFYEMAMAAFVEGPSQTLREKIGEIGRRGENTMFQYTDGVNTHKGAIWSLGLITAAAAIHGGMADEETICFTAGRIAQYEDRFIPHNITNGMKAIHEYGINGAKVEAQLAFPHIRKYSLPMLKATIHTMSYEQAKHFTLLSLIAQLDDTCILHRGGIEGLNYAKKQAKQIIASSNLHELEHMNQNFIARNLSPGGSADLLAATIYLLKIKKWSTNSLLKGQFQATH